jgi:predicted amino acid racemase
MRIEVDCDRIRRNAATIVEFCGARGIDVVGVTKSCCGHPEVAKAMLAGGVTTLADSRLSNVRRLHGAGVLADVMLLRLPALSEADEVVRLTQISLNSEVETVRALSRAAQARGLTHRVVLMVEMGDRREGVMPEDALEVARALQSLPGIDLEGLGTNLVCIGGVLPTIESTRALVDLAASLERALGIDIRVISGGNTYSLDFVLRDEMPAGVNQLRVGEGILLGVNSVTKEPLPCPHQDAFTVIAEVIEVKTKPSLPEGPIAKDAFGRVPDWQDLGLRRRAILALGEQDMRISGLRPRRHGVAIVGASSDHLVVDVTDAQPGVELGDELAFDLTYTALATAMAGADMPKVIRPSSAVPADGQTR